MNNEKKQRVIDAARAVFLKYGYKRVTMNDIAEAACISRPALYLIFPNKQEILKAVSKDTYLKILDELAVGLSRISSAEEQLRYAFEIWTVRPFTLIMSSAEAKELIDCCHTISKKIYMDVGAVFETQLVQILEPLMKSNKHINITSATMARILRHAIRGFKESAQDSAKSSEELRKMIKDFLDVILASIK